VVQGVGFRPFVHGLAQRLALAGHVGNDVHGVFIEVEGARAALDEFLRALHQDAPPLATVDTVEARPCPVLGAPGFAIVASEPRGHRATLVSADTATCAACLTELADPADRRYGYPFINCTDCGPRFTIVRDVPYDRPHTTMAPFPMCTACAAEYHDPTDRRFHAQPVCCPDCGPRLALAGVDDRGDPLATAAELLRGGGVLAVKGLGGYHLAALASDEKATLTLRTRKHRENKPFAVLAADLSEARRLAHVGPVEAALLTSRTRSSHSAQDKLGGASG